METRPSDPLRMMTEATLGAYDPPVRALLAPLLLYKSVFLGGWFDALARQERDPRVRDALAVLVKETLGESVSVLEAMRRWNEAPTGADKADTIAPWVQRRILEDLLVLKAGSNETAVHVAMHAPTDELRQRFLRLADVDRRHGDLLRELLGRATVTEAERRVSLASGPLGAHGGRGGAGALSRVVRDTLQQIRDHAEAPTRLVVSPEALRHLRDEGEVKPDGSALGLPVDVDFGWRGECFSVVTDDRVRLAELISRERME